MSQGKIQPIDNERLDNERRLRVERRRFHYSVFIPERRSGYKRQNPIFWLQPEKSVNFAPNWNSYGNGNNLG